MIARHRLVPAGTGATIRDEGHVTALTEAVLAAFTTAAPHRRKERRPPSPAARYAAAATGRNTLTPPAPTPSTEEPQGTIKETKHQ